jgi:hypothetical protein
MRRHKTGRDEIDEAAKGDCESDPLEDARSITLEDGPADDADLHAGEEDQCSGSSAEHDVGDREGEGVAEERSGTRPGAGKPKTPAAIQDDKQDREGKGARSETDSRIGEGIGSRACQGQAREDRVRGECDHRERGQRDDPAHVAPYAAVK